MARSVFIAIQATAVPSCLTGDGRIDGYPYTMLHHESLNSIANFFLHEPVDVRSLTKGLCI
jgi:hypothetical protein